MWALCKECECPYISKENITVLHFTIMKVCQNMYIAKSWTRLWVNLSEFEKIIHFLKINNNNIETRLTSVLNAMSYVVNTVTYTLFYITWLSLYWQLWQQSTCGVGWSLRQTLVLPTVEYRKCHHHVGCLMTGPQPLPKQVPQREWSRVPLSISSIFSFL